MDRIKITAQELIDRYAFISDNPYIHLRGKDYRDTDYNVSVACFLHYEQGNHFYIELVEYFYDSESASYIENFEVIT